MTVTVFGYLILIRIDFSILILRFLLSFSFDRPFNAVFDHISNASKFVKNTPLRVLFPTLFSVFGNVV